MLTPEQLQNLPQELTDLYDQLSEFILRDIARRIAKGAQITDTAEYQLYRARSLGLSTDEIAAKIAEINGSSAAEINRLIREAAAQSDEFDRKMREPHKHDGVRRPRFPRARVLPFHD